MSPKLTGALADNEQGRRVLSQHVDVGDDEAAVARMFAGDAVFAWCKGLEGVCAGVARGGCEYGSSLTLACSDSGVGNNPAGGVPDGAKQLAGGVKRDKGGR